MMAWYGAASLCSRAATVRQLPTLGEWWEAADCVDRTERMQLQQLCEGVDENSAALACEGVDENSRVWTKTRGNSFLFLKEQLKVIIIRQLHWSVPATN